MATLSQLPNEILMTIALEVEPGDVVNFATACKIVYYASEAALKRHVALQLQYQKIKNHDNGTFRSLSWLLREVLKNPPIGYYVRELWLHGWVDGLWSPQDEDKESDVRFVAAAFEQSGLPLLPYNDAAIKLRDRCKTLTIVLLFLHLPSLSLLRWKVEMADNEDYLVLQYLRHMFTEYSPPVLTKLRTVILQDRDCTLRNGVGSIPEHFISSFFLCPSVQTIKARTINEHFGLPGAPESPSEPPARLSNVSELTLNFYRRRDCSSEEAYRWLDKMLGSIKALRKCQYRMLPFSTVGDGGMNNLLQIHAQHSLEELKFPYRGKLQALPTGSLRRFTKLRVLEIEIIGPYRYPASRATFKARELPRSLQQLRLWIHGDEFIEVCLEEVEELIEQTKMLPRMTSVELYCHDLHDFLSKQDVKKCQDQIKMIRERGRQVGVSVDVKTCVGPRTDF
ncbi:uncharacterized protein KY384_007255 [Bacidia gigantensis]|uniref:uncharacterized protein n=1 Tax=Bacidia gigantensis TaxID=2732470 RepID=UPI001D05BE32|nr:uncharacterized protein KY384_007255 [Bacidia gigantensis]KAG8528337.1 hypothetical protein KY384_007255 [Bacidia gigantensis]